MKHLINNKTMAKVRGIEEAKDEAADTLTWMVDKEGLLQPSHFRAMDDATGLLARIADRDHLLQPPNVMAR